MTLQERKIAIQSKMISLEYSCPAFLRKAFKLKDENYLFLKSELSKL